MQRYSLFFTVVAVWAQKKHHLQHKVEAPLIPFTAYKQHLINTLENVMKLL